VITEVRKQLGILCRSSKTRRIGCFPEEPSDWRPGTVRVPGAPEMFTEASAWALIEKCLGDASIEMSELVLDKPPGKKAYVFKVPGHGDDEIYMKIHFGRSGKVIGRSFHVSEKPKKKGKRP